MSRKEPDDIGERMHEALDGTGPSGDGPRTANEAGEAPHEARDQDEEATTMPETDSQHKVAGDSQSKVPPSNR